jgi:hypothetical protein
LINRVILVSDEIGDFAVFDVHIQRTKRMAKPTNALLYFGRHTDFRGGPGIRPLVDCM